MPETISPPEAQEAPLPAEITELVRIVEALDAHRAALIWRNFLVRANGQSETHAAWIDLQDDIRAAASSHRQQTDFHYLRPVLDVENHSPETLKRKLLEHLRTVAATRKKEGVVTPEIFIQLREQCLENLYLLDGVVTLLQSQHVIHPDVPDILQKWQGLKEEVERRSLGLDITKEYIWYYNRNREIVALHNRVEALLNPFRAHERTDS